MLEKIKLAKSWNKHKKGSTVTVDSLRAEWLRKFKYETATIEELETKGT